MIIEHFWLKWFSGIYFKKTVFGERFVRSCKAYNLIVIIYLTNDKYTNKIVINII